MIRRVFFTLACLSLPLSSVVAQSPETKKKPKAKPDAAKTEAAKKTAAKDKAKAKDAPKPVPPPPPPSPWGDFYEKDFPFFSSVLDARNVGEGFPKDNLTPRGIILNLGHNLWACFDTDLLRIACIWEGEEGKPPVTPDGLAPGSYHVAGQKTKDGQDDLPKPIGKVWLANGIYPGWRAMNSPEEKPSFKDPREPGPSREEVGRGPAAGCEFQSLSLTPSGVIIRYRIDGAQINEAWGIGRKTNHPVIRRSFDVDGIRHSMHLPIGVLPQIPDAASSSPWVVTSSGGSFKGMTDEMFLWPEASGTPVVQPFILNHGSEHGSMRFGVSLQDNRDGVTPIPSTPLDSNRRESTVNHWPQAITTHAELAHAKAPSYVLDDIPLPLENPWKRNVRLADIDFLDDKGNAVGVTMDGDVWLISGLVGEMKEVKWKRFASGLHEPMSIVVRSEVGSGKSEVKSQAASPTSDLRPPNSIFVFDRNGIWKLVDTNGDGECDRYEMFCNLFAQTAETREFPNSMKLGPKGELYISKGGQEGTTFGKHNGTVIKVAPDGKSFEVIGYGLRQPFIGVHPKTGLVTASDQQGNYVPSTPLHIISDHHFYGHLPTIAPKEQYPETITEPLTWIPHPVNPSSVSQVWLTDAKMGPLNDEFMLVGYNRPELFRVLMNTRFQRPQATVMSFWRDFDFGPLNAHINPADGQLYVVGFQIWGTTAKKISGLARIRYTGGERVMLKECTPTDKGLILRFNAKLDTKLATDPASFSAERWNYKRTPEYGSPHLKLDGSPGQEWINASSAYLSKDGMSVLVGIPDMKAGVHQMRIGWGLKSATGAKAENTAYFTPWELLTFDPVKEGFGDIKVDLTPRKTAEVALAKPTAEEGQRLYQMVGCMACHSTDGTTVGKVGPSWRGIYGTEREIGKANGENVKTPLKVNADEAYLHESIVNPPAKVVKGFEKFDAGMPIYNGILNESQIQSLILFIKSLK